MKIALVGSCPSSRLLAPFNDPEWQIWACSPLDVGIFPRVTAWFEVHGDWDWPEVPEENPHYLPWLRAQKFTVYAQRTDLIPNALKFPARELVEEFGPYWFTSSLAWMFAFAIKQGATEIGVFGADMTTRNEYLHQRPAMQRWMEFASGRGIKVFVPEESDLMQPPELYGYSCMSPMGRKIAIRKAELKHRITSGEHKLKQLEYDLQHLRGALDNNDYMSTAWIGGLNNLVDE